MSSITTKYPHYVPTPYEMKEYFYDLNYTLANEDTTLEYEMVKELKPKFVLSVCGSGGRALPLICGGAERLDAIDVVILERELSVRVTDPKVFLVADIDQAVITNPAVGVDHRIEADLPPN